MSSELYEAKLQEDNEALDFKYKEINTKTQVQMIDEAIASLTATKKNLDTIKENYQEMYADMVENAEYKHGEQRV